MVVKVFSQGTNIAHEDCHSEKFRVVVSRLRDPEVFMKGFDDAGEPGWKRLTEYDQIQLCHAQPFGFPSFTRGFVVSLAFQKLTRLLLPQTCRELSNGVRSFDLDLLRE